jgi:predicted Fe-Mo cluster-binding NifX family protein
MNDARIAIPSTLPGGLEAEVGAHFGHCDLYTIVDLVDGALARVDTLPCVPHEQGGCLAAVNHLAGHGVTALVALGLGLRPLTGCEQAGIQVYRGAGATTVAAAVQALLAGELPRFARESTCAGGHHHGAGHTH